MRNPAGGLLKLPPLVRLGDEAERCMERGFLLVALLQIAGLTVHLLLQGGLYSIYMIPALILPVAAASSGLIQARNLSTASIYMPSGKSERLGLPTMILLLPLFSGLLAAAADVGISLMQDLPFDLIVANLYRGLAVSAVLALFCLTSYLIGYRCGRSGAGSSSALLIPLIVPTAGLLAYPFSSAAALLGMLSPATPAVLPLTQASSAGPMGTAVDGALGWLHFFDIGSLSALLPLAVVLQLGIALLALPDLRSGTDRPAGNDYRLLAVLLLPVLLINLYHATLSENWLGQFQISGLPLPPYLTAVAGMSLIAAVLLALSRHCELHLSGPVVRPRLTTLLYPAILGVLFMLPGPTLFDISWLQVIVTGSVLLGAGIVLALWSRVRVRMVWDLGILGMLAVSWFALSGV